MRIQVSLLMRTEGQESAQWIQSIVRVMRLTVALLSVVVVVGAVSYAGNVDYAVVSPSVAGVSGVNVMTEFAKEVSGPPVFAALAVRRVSCVGVNKTVRASIQSVGCDNVNRSVMGVDVAEGVASRAVPIVVRNGFADVALSGAVPANVKLKVAPSVAFVKMASIVGGAVVVVSRGNSERGYADAKSAVDIRLVGSQSVVHVCERVPEKVSLGALVDVLVPVRDEIALGVATHVANQAVNGAKGGYVGASVQGVAESGVPKTVVGNLIPRNFTADHIFYVNQGSVAVLGTRKSAVNPVILQVNSVDQATWGCIGSEVTAADPAIVQVNPVAQPSWVEIGAIESAVAPVIVQVTSVMGTINVVTAREAHQVVETDWRAPHRSTYASCVGVNGVEVARDVNVPTVSRKYVSPWDCGVGVRRVFPVVPGEHSVQGIDVWSVAFSPTTNPRSRRFLVIKDVKSTRPPLLQDAYRAASILARYRHELSRGTPLKRVRFVDSQTGSGWPC